MFNPAGMRHNLFVFLLGNAYNRTIVIKDNKAGTTILYEMMGIHIQPSCSLINGSTIHEEKNAIEIGFQNGVSGFPNFIFAAFSRAFIKLMFVEMYTTIHHQNVLLEVGRNSNNGGNDNTSIHQSQLQVSVWK